MTKSICLLDQRRAEHPHLGVGVYAFDPGGPVTLEIHTPDGQVFTWTDRTLAAALERAFPPEEPAEPEAPAVSNTPTDIFA